jgi:hypothetical protein
MVEFETKRKKKISNKGTLLQGENVLPNKRKKLKEASNFLG